MIRLLEVAQQMTDDPHDSLGLTAFRDSGLAVAAVFRAFALMLALPSSVRGPLLQPPCILQRPEAAGQWRRGW
jgi:hypothetical protein